MAWLQEEPNAYETWGGDLVERLTCIEGMDTSAQRLYDEFQDECTWDLIADSTGYIDFNMGFAGANALNIYIEGYDD